MPRFRLAILLFASVLPAGSVALAQLPEVSTDPSALIPVDPAIRSGTLPNGLRYYVRKHGWPERRAELRLAVNAGSVLEDDDQRGLAHFVEHMAFNGTRNFQKQELVDYIEGLGMRFGAHLNASTSFDETIYQLQVPTDSASPLERGLQILEDWAHGVSFDPEEVEKERGVVVEEWRLGLGAEMRMLDAQLPVLLRGSRYASRLPIGDRATLQSAPRDALVRFYRDWYRPDLMAVIAVGDFDPDRVEALIREKFGRIAAPAAARPRPVYRAPEHAEPLVAIATDPEATSSRVAVYEKAEAVAERTVGAYRQRFLDAIDDGILNLRLFERSRQANPPFIGAGAGRGGFVRTIDIEFLGAAVADGGLLTGLEAILTESARVRQHGYTAGELERGRQEYLRGLEQAYDERERTPASVLADEYVRNFLSEEPIPGIAYEFALAQALVPGITLEGLNASTRRRRRGVNQVMLVNAPAKETVSVPDEQELLGVFARVAGSAVTAYADDVSGEDLVPIVPAPARIVTETADTALGTTTWTLENGVRVILKPTDFRQDEVLVSAWSPGGYSLASAADQLNAALAPTLMGLGGVGAFDAVSLQKKLAGKAVDLNPWVGLVQEGLRGRASPKDLETLFQLIWLYATAPRPDSIAFQAFATNVRAALANRGADPDAVFGDTLSVTLTSHHPYTRPFTSERVDELDLMTAARVYRDRFADASDFTFLFVGRFDLDSLRPLVQRYIGGLPALRRAERWRDPGIRAPDGVVERVVRKGIEPKSRTQLVFTGDLAYGPESRLALHWLSEVLTIRLREELREELGGTYGVSVSASPSRLPREEYSFSIAFGSAPDRAEQLLAAVWTEIERLQAEGAQERDLAKVREADVRADETNRKRNAWWMAQLTHLDQTGEAPLVLEPVQERVRRLTPELIREAARKYLNRGRYVRVTLLPEGEQ